MAKAAKAAQVDGDSRVVAHPSFRTVPEPLFKLQTEEARREYATLARTLFEAGRMTTHNHRALSNYAMTFDGVTRNEAEGKVNRPAAFIHMMKVLRALKLDDLDQPIAAPEGSKANPFALAGFASKRR